MNELFSLDIETAPTTPTDLPFALEPYRVLSGQAEITSVALHGPNDFSFQAHYKQDTFHKDVKDMLERLIGKKVYAHHAIFDIAFLLATFNFDAVKSIRWRDTALLEKYLVNGQKADRRNVSYSLKDAVKRHFYDHPDTDEFLGIKNREVKAGEEFDYWLLRGRMDAMFTFMLAMKLETYLKPEIERGYIVTCNSMVPIARGWVHGIQVDTESLAEYEKTVVARQKEICAELGVNASQLSSDKQLANILFNDYGLKPVGFTPKGAPSVSAENLQRLHQAHDDHRLDLIMEFRKLKTMMSKYVNGFKNSIKYIGENKIHGAPRVLSTITGRMTYSSKLLKKYQVAIAQHQLPRKEKSIKRAMVPPKGYVVLYVDFSAQEGRVMAIVAPEPTMIAAYNNNIDLHSDLTEEIFGTPYDVIYAANKSGKPEEIVEQRQAGKLTGLSSFYRIGAKALAGKFFSTYGYDISIPVAQSYLTSFKRKYPGVPQYWDRAIGDAKINGYAEAFGGWRYRIDTFDWKGESSAINHPIQGGGSMLTYAAISVIGKKWEDATMVSQVHDSLAYFIPEEGALEMAREIIRYMSNYDYGKLLGFEQTVPLLLDGGIGPNFADIVSV